MRPRRTRPEAALALALLLAACSVPARKGPPAAPIESPPPASPLPRVEPAPKPSARPPSAPAPGTLVARNDEYVVWAVGPGDTPASLARRVLGSEGLAWVVEDFNGGGRWREGEEVVVPLVFDNPVGVWREGYQTLPILCYHRFSDRTAKMAVSPRAFTEQMAYLADNGFRVVALRDVLSFFDGRQALPRKAVALTIDDGYRSAYLVAYPILKRFGFPATLFVYTDFVGAKEGLTWAELAEMAASGLIDVQPHSRSHGNLAARSPGEDGDAAARRLVDEFATPKRLIEERLGLAVHTFGYPYGDADDRAVEEARRQGYRAAATVLRGGNPFFASPYLLRRTMVFGEDDLGAFRGKVEVFRSLPAP